MDNLISHPPVLKPLHVPVRLVGSDYAPADGHKVDVQANRNGIQSAVRYLLHNLVSVTETPVDQEARCQNGKVKRRVVVMNVGDTGHDNKWKVVKEPANDRVDTSIVDVVDLGLVQLSEATLPADDVPSDRQAEDAQREGRSPVNKGVAQKEVLDNIVVPTTHAQSNVQNRPLPPLGGQVILLVRVGYQSIVGRHHGNVEVNKVVDEWRLVLARLCRR